MNTRPDKFQDAEQPVTQAQLAWTQNLIADSLKSLVTFIEIRDDEDSKHEGADLIEKLQEHVSRLELAAVRPEPNPSIDW